MSESFYHPGGDITLDYYPEKVDLYHKIQVTWPSPGGSDTVYLDPNETGAGPHEIKEYDKPQGTVTVDFWYSPSGLGPWQQATYTGQAATTWDRRVWAETDDEPAGDPDEKDANVVVT